MKTFFFFCCILLTPNLLYLCERKEMEMNNNRLKRLRLEANISLRELQNYTGITNSVLSVLESGKRPFRQTHIDALSSFFNVTSDFLLGRSDYGYKVFPEYGTDELILSEAEYNRLIAHINVSVIYKGHPTTKVEVDTPVEEQNVVMSSHIVYRELKGTVDEYDLQETLYQKYLEKGKHMTTNELKRTIKFIDDYILIK